MTSKLINVIGYLRYIYLDMGFISDIERYW